MKRRTRIRYTGQVRVFLHRGAALADCLPLDQLSRWAPGRQTCEPKAVQRTLGRRDSTLPAFRSSDPMKWHDPKWRRRHFWPLVFQYSLTLAGVSVLVWSWTRG